MSAGGKMQRRLKVTVRYESLEAVTVRVDPWPVGRQDVAPCVPLEARVMKARP